jgi:hypothetical protein
MVEIEQGVIATIQDIGSICADFRDVVLVRYLDHVLYNRASAFAMKPQVRKAVGWLIYESDKYIIIAWDSDDEPPTLHGGDPKASGLVLLKSDILELKKLPLQRISEHHLNCQDAKGRSEYALQPKEAKNSKNKKREKQ